MPIGWSNDGRSFTANSLNGHRLSKKEIISALRANTPRVYFVSIERVVAEHPTTNAQHAKLAVNRRWMMRDKVSYCCVNDGYYVQGEMNDIIKFARN